MSNVLLFDAEQSWKMSEPEKVLAIIKEVGLWRLADWEGCCCSSFSIRNVHVDISCGTGRPQAVWMHSSSMDYPEDGDHDKLLQPIMDEVVRQLDEQSGRGGTFSQYFKPWVNE